MIDLYTLITSIIFGIVEGITEFLPISSTSHMIIASNLFRVDNNNTKILEMFIQFGSSLAILCFFRKKLFQIIGFNGNYSDKKKNIHILIAIVPTIFVGLLYYKEIKLFFNTNDIIYSLILGGFFLFISEIFKPKISNTNNINDISLFQSMIIGFFQVLSLYPGVSRSGMTIGTAMLLGIKRSVGIEFSFIISIPLLIGASLFDLINNINNIKTLNMLMFFIGFIVSFIVSLLCIKYLLKIINQTSLIFFGIYRFIIAGLIYFFN